MLGICGQAKSISQRSGDAKKGNSKLPIISPPKAEKSTQRKNVSGGKRKSTSSQLVSSPIKGNEIVVKRPQNVLEIAKFRLESASGTVGESGTVKVRFNHYNKSFPIHNGVLKWADIDEEYCLSFVYKGNFTRNLVNTGTRLNNSEQGTTCDEEDHDVVDGRRMAKHDENFTYYINIADKSEYTLDVVEDPVAGIGAEGLRLNAGPLKLSELSTAQSAQAIRSTSRAMDAITAELKSIAVTELNDAHAKDLIERRDLEDILYSG